MSSGTRTRKLKKNSGFVESVKGIIFSAQGLPIVLGLIIITISFVLFRMKGVEMNYQLSSISKDIDKVKTEGKELKAKKAKLLSVKNLRRMAKSHNLQQPRQKQIIVIPK